MNKGFIKDRPNHRGGDKGGKYALAKHWRPILHPQASPHKTARRFEAPVIVTKPADPEKLEEYRKQKELRK